MKRIYIIAVFVCFFMLQNQIHGQGFAQMDKNPVDISYLKSDNYSKPLIRVVYSRPKKETEKVFGGQVPFDKVWRTGANEATEIKFYNDVKIGNKIVRAGVYTLHTIPGEKEWTIILNSKTDTWGTVFYEPLKDVVRIKVPAKKGKPVDIFSIAFSQNYNDTFMVLAWDTTRVGIPIETNVQILADLY
jgi:hypothetical protein